MWWPGCVADIRGSIFDRGKKPLLSLDPLVRLRVPLSLPHIRVSKALSLGVMRPGCGTTSRFHPVSRLSKRGAKHSLFQTLSISEERQLCCSLRTAYGFSQLYKTSNQRPRERGVEYNIWICQTGQTAEEWCQLQHRHTAHTINMRNNWKGLAENTKDRQQFGNLSIDGNIKLIRKQGTVNVDSIHIAQDRT